MYLFLSVPGSFDASLGNISENPVVTVVIAVGAVVLIVLLARIFWRQLKKLWVKAKQGGSDPLSLEGVLNAFVSAGLSVLGCASSR